MTASTGKRPFHLKRTCPTDPQSLPLERWPAALRNSYLAFWHWLRTGGYRPATCHIYGVAARYAFGWLDKPPDTIDPGIDLAHFIAYLETRPLAASTRCAYIKGLCKLNEYLRSVYRRPAPLKPIRWETHLADLPEALAADLRRYLAYRQAAWPAERRRENSQTLLSHLTLPLRWLAAHGRLTYPLQISAADWRAYVAARLAAGTQARTLNAVQRLLGDFAHWLAEQGAPLGLAFLAVEPLKAARLLPRDLTPRQASRLRAALPTGPTRQTALDQAWFHLMLFSGLRTGEIRALRLEQLDLERQQVRVAPFKGGAERVVPISPEATTALRAYLSVRGSANESSEHLFTWRHKPLSRAYCWSRLGTLGKECSIQASPHQLRHTCASLFLNAGMSIWSLQRLLGHRHVETTLGYARLYDRTIAAGYFQAMAHRAQFVEGRAPPG